MSSFLGSLFCFIDLYALSEYHTVLISVQFSLVTQSCLTLCDPMNCRTPGLPVHHQFPEFTQTHFHRVGDAIQPSHPLSSPSIRKLVTSSLVLLSQGCTGYLKPSVTTYNFQNYLSSFYKTCYWNFYRYCTEPVDWLG